MGMQSSLNARLKTTDEKYFKLRAEIFDEMDIAIGQLQNIDFSVRKKGLRTLQRRSLIALVSIKADIVSDWFLEEKNRKNFFAIISTEKDEKTLTELIFTLEMICERHAQANQCFYDKPICVEYIEESRNLINNFIDHPSSKVLATVAGILAYFKDTKAWDIYCRVLNKYQNYLTVSRFRFAYQKYAEFSITNEQINQIKIILADIEQNTKNSEVKEITTDLIKLMRTK